MGRCALVVLVVLVSVLLLATTTTNSDEPIALTGYSAEQARAEREWEGKFRDIPTPDNLRDYMKRLSARPHHVGSPYDKDNAEWLLAKFKGWGLDTHIENFDVLFPTPKERVVELLEPAKFVAKLQEPPLAIDPTSNQQSEQLPTYNAYSIDGDVTAPLVYVNYGVPEDYEKLDRIGVSGAGLSRKWRLSTELSGASFIPTLATMATSKATCSRRARGVRETAPSVAV